MLVSFICWGQTHSQEGYTISHFSGKKQPSVCPCWVRYSPKQTQMRGSCPGVIKLGKALGIPYLFPQCPLGVLSEPAIPSSLTCPLLPQSLAFLQTWEGGTPAVVAVCCEQREPRGAGRAADAGALGTNQPLQPGLKLEFGSPWHVGRNRWPSMGQM